MSGRGARALHEVFPELERRVPFCQLGDFPTPVAQLGGLAATLGCPGAPLWEKRDDLTSPLYGGNKVRTLEVLFAEALEQGARHIVSTGAYGSNHAAATAMHAPRVGLHPGICVYPQPPSPAALENLRLVLSRRPRPLVVDLPHWSALPYGILHTHLLSRRRGLDAVVMMPGGAVPRGALGYVSAAFELAQQVKRGELPSPERVILPVGSNCTSAGLLLGFWLADRLGLGLSPRPVVVSVRVTPWPVTIPYRILGLALEAGKLLGELLGRPSLVPDRAALASHLEIDPRRLGPGYGFATDEGREAVRLWDAHVGHPLETTYSGKAAARVIAELHRGIERPTLFWATKSSATLPEVHDDEVAWASRRMRRWMAHAAIARD